MSLPLVSIGIAQYSSLELLANLIEHLSLQTYTNIEIIIAVNNSTEVSDEQIIHKKLTVHQIRIVKDTSGSLDPKALVFNHAHGTYFVWADANYLWNNVYLHECVSKLEENSHAVLCACNLSVNQDVSNSSSEEIFSARQIVGGHIVKGVQKLLAEFHWHEITGIIRVETLKKINVERILSNRDFRSDVILLMHLLLVGELEKVDKPLIYSQNAMNNIWTDHIYPGDKPYTNLIQKLIHAIYASKLDSATKQQIQILFIETLSLLNINWQKKIIAEYNLDTNAYLIHQLLGFFVESILLADSYYQAVVSTGNFKDNQFKELSTNVRQNVNKRNSLSAIHASLPYKQEQKDRAKTLLFAHYHKLYPPRDGADNRCFATLTAMQELGYQVVLFGSTLFQYVKWSYSSLDYIEQKLKIKVVLYVGGKEDDSYMKSNKPKWDNLTPPGLRKYFYKIFLHLKPDLIWINYAFWAKLAIGKEYAHTPRIIDTIDLLSLNQKMASVAWRYLNMSKPNGFRHNHKNIAPQFLEEDFYSNLKLQVDPKEYTLYNSFNLSIAINPREKEIIAANTSDTLVEYVPFAFQTADISNTYNEQAIFAVGPNQFNIQGYMYFVSKVLPIVLEKCPDFCLQVVGDGCRFITEVEGTKLHGFVPDLQAMYASSKFAICPLIGATGQQLKVLEAMAHGLPVIALRNVAERCPIEHGVNGFVADDAEEFALCTIQLFQDAQLCRKLGEAARQRIQNEFSRKSMVLQLNKSIHNLQVKGWKNEQKKAISIIAALKYNTLATQEKLFYIGKLGWKKIDFLKRKLALRVRIKKIMGRA